MAAAYLRVNCKAFPLAESIEVRAHSRMLRLLNEPHPCGFVDIPTDPVRVEKYPTFIIDTLDAEIPGISNQAATLNAASADPKLHPAQRAEAVEYILAAPVCGWNQHLDLSNAQ